MDAELGKDRIKVSFNTYDLFGYLIPGAIMLLCIIFFEFWIKFQLNARVNSIPLHLPFLNAVTEASRPFFESKDWVLSVVFLIVILVISYSVGHIVSSISSFSIDRILVFKGYGYPYQHLLNLEYPNRNWETGPFYRGLFFWVNAYLLSLFFKVLKPGVVTEVAEKIIFWFITMVIIIKLLIGFFRGNSVKKILSKIPQSLKREVNRILKFIIIRLFALPYDILTVFLSRFIETRSRFSDEFLKSYKDTFNKLFGLKADEEETNNFWFSKCFIAYMSPTLDSMLVNWHYLYSYARNLATAFYLAFLYCFLTIYLQKRHFLSLNNEMNFYIPVFYFALSLIMLGRYYYLYYIYYNKFLFRAFYFLTRPWIKGSTLQSKKE